MYRNIFLFCNDLKRCLTYKYNGTAIITYIIAYIKKDNLLLCDNILPTKGNQVIEQIVIKTSNILLYVFFTVKEFDFIVSILNMFINQHLNLPLLQQDHQMQHLQ